jgi:hypothetical protein
MIGTYFVNGLKDIKMLLISFPQLEETQSPKYAVYSQTRVKTIVKA